MAGVDEKKNLADEKKNLGCPTGLAPAFEEENSANPEAFVQKTDELSFIELAIEGAKCAGCIAKIENGVRELTGIENVRLNLSTSKLYVSWSGDLSSRQITEKISALGYKATPYDPYQSERKTDDHGRMLMRCLAVAGFATANIMLISVGVWAATNGEMGEGTRAFMHFISAIIAIPAAAYAGRPFFRSALDALKSGSANMDVPISLAVILAVGFSLFETWQGGHEAYFDAAVMLLFFLLIGRWLDHALRNKAREAARDLIALQAVSANLQADDGTVTAISAKDIKPGDTLLLSPGDRVPVNGIILSGKSDMDLSIMTGESEPTVKKSGDQVEAGILNISQSLTMQATATVDDSLIAELTRMVEAGQQSKSHFVRLADKAARAYVPIVHTLAALTFLGWFFVLDGGFRVSLMNAIAVLIITCPCALGLATPAVQIVATGRLFKEGILVKTGDALERLSQVTSFAFDKTGTITLGKLSLINGNVLSKRELALAAALARTSRHPISRAIVAAAGPGIVADNVVEEPGLGISGSLDGQKIKLGRAHFVDPALKASDTDVTTSWLKIGEAPAIELQFEDTLKKDAAATIKTLLKKNMKVSLLSGDRAAPVKRVAAQSGIEDFYAELTPQQKIDHLQAQEKAGDKTAMVGDGLNDTPALAEAHVSISPGSAAEAAQSAADFVFQGDGLAAVDKAHEVSKLTQRHILQNFAFAALYNCVAAPLAMAGYVTPLIAALAMSGSSLVVTLNALRLNIQKRETV